MMDSPHSLHDTRLGDGRAALRGGRWEEARARFRNYLSNDPECAEAWEGVAASCYWLQDVAAMFEARQEAYRLYRLRGDSVAAARIATWLGGDFLEFRGEAAVAAGWIERARQLLEGSERTVEHAWQRAMEAHLALAIRNDPMAAKAAAMEARKIARECGDVDYEILASATEGLARVIEGEVADGMRLLDGAAAAALGGEMTDLNAISITCCFVIQACERVRDFGRASEWCRRFEEICARWRLGTFLTFCRIQHGTVLMWRGEWAAAEAELIAARDDFDRFRPVARAAALVRLGELRRRQGRWDEAAQLLEMGRAHRLSTLLEGALALDRGDSIEAEDAAVQVLRRAPRISAAERLPALDLLVRARVARGAVEEAASELCDLEALATSIGTQTVRGIALFAAGVMAHARGQYDDARQRLQDAVEMLSGAGCPFEEAQARLELSRVLQALDRNSAAKVQAGRALGIFERLGAGRAIEVVRELVGETDAAIHPVPGLSTAPGLTERQLAVLRLVAQGLTNREVAAALSLSEFTVRRHLANIYTRLGVASRAAAVARALRSDLL